jgi:hypothetical protein
VRNGGLFPDCPATGWSYVTYKRLLCVCCIFSLSKIFSIWILLLISVVEAWQACAGVRVPVGPVAGAAWGAGDQICADCRSRRSAGSMVQCRMCVRWYHRSCGGGSQASQASAVDWVCKACDVVVAPPSPGGSPPHGLPPATARGPMALALRPVHDLSFFLSFTT